MNEGWPSQGLPSPRPSAAADRGRGRGILLLGGLLVASCGSVPRDEGLVILEVSATAVVPPFASVRFSVVGRPTVRPHEVLTDPARTLRFGYYLPGPSGPADVQAEAVAATGCVVGNGTAPVEVEVGRISPPVTLVIGPAAGGGAGCPSGGDGATDGRGADAAPDAVEAGADVRPPDAVDASPPVCLAATSACSSTTKCCASLTCGTTSLGQVCCANFGGKCTRVGGEDCCGQLECINGGCCLPATRPCQGTNCCLGLVCGTTSLGRVCCGNAGAPCTRSDGADCCGSLLCKSGTCG